MSNEIPIIDILKECKLVTKKNEKDKLYKDVFCDDLGLDTADELEDWTQEELQENAKMKFAHMKKLIKVLNKYGIQISKGDSKEEKKDEPDLYPERKNWKGIISILNEPSLVSDREISKRQMKQKTLLIIGETGVGKSTLINSMVNYLYGVRFEDNYKLQLINEEKLLKLAKESKTSVTRNITKYSITPSIELLKEYVITILDTPGFGDTGGYERDEEIFEDITNYFKNKLNSITAICIVVKSSDTRSTITQQYIFSRLFSLFGKDVEKNVYVLCTFASLNTPPCIEVLKSKQINCPFEEYFKFDNSAFFIKKSSDKEKLQVQSLYYSICIKSFNNFYCFIKKKKDVPLKLTKDKFTKEEKLKFKIGSVRENIASGVENVNSLEDLKYQIKTTTSQKNKIKDKVEYPMKKRKFVKQYKTPGTYTTICNSCQWTCHDDCSIPPGQKQGCWAINSSGYCTQCPEGCHHGIHTNEPYVYVPEYYTVMVTNKEILKDYNNYDNTLSETQNALNSVQSQLDSTRNQIVQDFKDIQTLNKELKKISLRYKPVTQKQYLIMLIEKEKKELKEGWKGRVDEYNGIIDKISLKSGELKGSSNLDKIFSTNTNKTRSKKWGIFGW